MRALLFGTKAMAVFPLIDREVFWDRLRVPRPRRPEQCERVRMSGVRALRLRLAAGRQPTVRSPLFPLTPGRCEHTLRREPPARVSGSAQHPRSPRSKMKLSTGIPTKSMTLRILPSAPRNGSFLKIVPIVLPDLRRDVLAYIVQVGFNGVIGPPGCREQGGSSSKMTA
jgi:hypothetical protein